jgi:hypothetical protein
MPPPTASPHGDPLPGPASAEPQDETVVLRPDESDSRGGDAGSNGADEAEGATARTSQAPDESE